MKFGAEQFTATKWDSGEDKAKGLSALVSFIQAGFPEAKFTRRVYDVLYLHLFGHIAHFNKAGFYAEWFATPARQLAWLRYAARGGAYGAGHGDPAYTWSDVETVLVDWLRSSGVVNRYEAIVEGQTRSRELAQLAYLQGKYEAGSRVAA